MLEQPSTAATLEAAQEFIRVRGCRVHNLRNIDLDIPRNRLVVLTGPSGSGKSSLAFDTLFAEGQRQYIESLSTYARQFLHQLQRPDVDLIEGLQPTVSIDQRPGAQNPRSTVATVTEIHDHLRLLYARVGQPFCYQCGAPIAQQTPEQIQQDILALPEGSKVVLLAPIVRGRKGQHLEALAAIRKAGFVRARVDGTVYEIDAVPKLVKQKLHTIEAVVDRLLVRETIATRLAESIQLALRHGEGLLAISYLPADDLQGPWRDRILSTEYACPNCKISYEELQPRTFSFNSPYGACAGCEGLGSRLTFDPDLVLPDHRLAVSAAVAPWHDEQVHVRAAHRRQLLEFLRRSGVERNTRVDALKAKVLKALVHGETDGFPGLLALLEEEYRTAEDAEARDALGSYRGAVACPDCGGARLRPEARSVEVGGLRIQQAVALTIREAAGFFAGLEFLASQAPVAEPMVREIRARLDFLIRVGLPYLTLDRAADSLSGGELQRIRLATGIGSGLVGVCYILDEPSIGLHPRDNQRLIEALRNLEQQGNTVLVVEHDEALMRQADWLFDLGPGAGREGGLIVAEGTPAQVADNPQSLTGQYLAGKARIEVPRQRRPIDPSRAVFLEGATTNNLKNVDVAFPLSVLVAITGVSGSGKSSLLNETLSRAVARQLRGGGPKPGPYRRLSGLEHIDKFIEIDQTPIGRTPRSNPATYTGVFDEVRRVFAHTREARLRGYGAGRFSFNIKGGRCEACQGQGMRKIAMNFLPDLYVPCEVCGGTRFNRQTLEVHYRDRSIADVLAMRIDEAAEFFENFPGIRRVLVSLQQVGLGYLTLGQSCTTLSGGEAQRIKLGAELARVETGKTLYVLDEPTTGLHFDDVRRLLEVLGQLVDRGNTVIVIEHNLDVIKSADWIIDLGPEGGAGGGYLLAAGTPEQIAAIEGNETGEYLRSILPR